MIRSFDALRHIEPGFTRSHTLQTFGLTIPVNVASDLDEVTRIHQEVLNKLAAVPGVTSAAFTTRLPMDPRNRWSAALSVDGQPHDGKKSPPNRQVKLISPGAFQTFGTPLVAGRDFTWTDSGMSCATWQSFPRISRANIGDQLRQRSGKRIRQFYGAQRRRPRGSRRRVDVHDDGLYKQAPATVYWPARLDPESLRSLSATARQFRDQDGPRRHRQSAGGVASSGLLVEFDAPACAREHAGCVVRPVDVSTLVLRSCSCWR